MGEIFDFLTGKSKTLEFIKIVKSNRTRYRNQAMKDYKSTQLDDCIEERAKTDLHPKDNVKKYKSDLYKWFKRSKDAYNQWMNKHSDSILRGITDSEKMKFIEYAKITDNDFPLIYHIKDLAKKMREIGYEVYSLNEHEDIIKAKKACPKPNLYRNFGGKNAPNDYYDKKGFDKYGYNREGYDAKGYDEDGYNKKGYNKHGYNREGYDKDGYDKYGYDHDGYDRNGFDNDGYNRDGYDRDGYDRDGYDSSGYDSDGYDIFGNHEDDWD